jgi:glucan-binding YG repeat protein
MRYVVLLCVAALAWTASVYAKSDTTKVKAAEKTAVESKKAETAKPVEKKTTVQAEKKAEKEEKKVQKTVVKEEKKAVKAVPAKKAESRKPAKKAIVKKETPAGKETLSTKPAAEKKQIQKTVKQADQPKKAVAVEKSRVTQKKSERQAKKKERKASRSNLKVARSAICPEVVNHEPKSSATRYEKGDQRLCCFSKITGAQDTTQIQHKWYHKDNLIGMAILAIKSSNFRTYSARNIKADQDGPWKVEIVDPNSEIVLETVNFIVE